MTRFTSRKFILAVVGGLLVFANKAWDLGLSDVDIQMVLGFFATFIFAEGAADIVTQMRHNRDKVKAEAQTESFE